MFSRTCCVTTFMASLAFGGLIQVAHADVTPHAGMLRYPDVSATDIVFVYANDLWLVSREGGQATPLASPPGLESFPKFSPDGSSIAFIGNYDGDRDLYTIPVKGGIPHRVTHHPATENICDWTPDGKLLFSASNLIGLGRTQKLYTTSANGGLPESLPLPYGASASISPDGQWLAYTPHSRDHRTWKRYRGGLASDIWLLNLKTYESEKITDWEGTDTQPMWHKGTVYYLSDAEDPHRLNMWSYNTKTKDRKQLTRFTEYDVKWPSIGPGSNGQGEIVFQNGTSLYLLNLRSNQSKPISVTIPGARPTIRTKRVDASKHIDWWHISSTGKRAVVTARGDVWTIPAEKGSPRNLTRTNGAAERWSSWSPDGKWIAYFSDATGEYELYITQSDGKGETKQLTFDSATYYEDPVWSPDSKHILFTDKAYNIYLHTIESGETNVFDQDPWQQVSRPSWSHDSRWITYARTNEDSLTRSVWVYNVENDENHRVTSGMFDDNNPTFDRMGDYLFFGSGRSFSPTYSDLDTTFVYHDSEVLIAVPLREDVKSPWLPESDEEEWNDDENSEVEESESDDENDDAEGDEDSDDSEDEDGDSETPIQDDGVSGTWEGSISGSELPPGMEFVLHLTLASDGTTLTGSITVPMGSGEVNATYDPISGEIYGTVTTDEGDTVDIRGTIIGSSITFTATHDGRTFELNGERTSVGSDSDDSEKKKGKAREVVEIALADFERRSIQLPIPNGSFSQLAVNQKNQLIYVRQEQGGDSKSSIMLFDLDDAKKEEQTVLKGAGGFEMSGDGKKLLAVREGGASILDASANATPKSLSTDGMYVEINPREEWNQLVNDAWRFERIFFYVENMHGVDWSTVREQSLAMLPDCTTREDVSFVIGEMIAELNIGHAYYWGGDEEDEPEVPVGLLGADWELDNGAYKIARIYNGADWDVDARSPLSEPGIDVNEGDYILKVNGIEVDSSKDPWAAFVGTAGRTITMTVSESPLLDDTAREVVITPIASENDLRYRAWIEQNRAYVSQRSSGQVGYIYVPNTGINGQNDLYRQFVGQAYLKALIIDERWNGGGQIPTRFIELLNRPVTNYWARRDSKDWKWPPDAHHGPKCMVVNGHAGSGGDMFPWLFRQAGLGPIIGTRTWGGLVGISGNPNLIDGAVVTVPTFGFYEKDGTWGIEGHGVDPDIEVIDDPSLMVNGGDPQLDKAIDVMLDAIEREPYTPPSRPAPPDRSGMGIMESDK